MSNKPLTADHENVAQEIASLHQLLNNSLIADPCTEQHLRLVTKELELIIATGKTPDQALAESLDSLFIAYEQDHPVIAQALKQVINALGNIGV